MSGGLEPILTMAEIVEGIIRTERRYGRLGRFITWRRRRWVKATMPKLYEALLGERV